LSVFVKFARKYFEEALRDLERARRALSFEDYPQAVFYAQQSVERRVKALLEARRRAVYNSGAELVFYLAETYRDSWFDELEFLASALEFLSEYYSRARYPFLLRGEVVSPSEFIDKSVAIKAVELAEKSLKVVESVLRRQGVI